MMAGMFKAESMGLPYGIGQNFVQLRRFIAALNEVFLPPISHIDHEPKFLRWIELLWS